MDLTEIIFWLFARLRPVLWYYHRLTRIIEAFVAALSCEEIRGRLAADPRLRAWWAGILADGERLFDIAVSLRAQEIMGRPVPVIDDPRLKGAARIHSAPTFESLLVRLSRLIERHGDIERLARLRVFRLRSEAEAAPVLLVSDHRPHHAGLPLPVIAASPASPASTCDFAGAAAGRRIRAPP